MASENGIHTYTGAWINWTHGAILGATLTLSSKYGGLLAAFLAIYASFTGVMFWRLLCFVLHQICTTRPGDTRDGLHQQRQAILRNSGGAASAVWEFAQLPISWRGKTRRPFLRVFIFALLAALTVSVFGVASIFTSEITRGPGNSTIILGPACGGYAASGANSSRQMASYLSKIQADTNDAATYARQCYRENTTSLACNVYIRPSLNFTTNPNATCPFPSGLCIFNNQSAFSMDTGLVDSHSDLGVNARPEYRIKYRRVTTCAPINYSRWLRVVNDSTAGEEIHIDAGPAYPNNYTFYYPLHTAQDGVGYQLSAVMALTGQASPWDPVPLLNRTDADVTLMMLNQNDIAYLEPSDDPWMPAHNEYQGIWVGDYDVNIMACIDQYQICNPNKGNGLSACTKLSGGFPVLVELGLPGNAADLNNHQHWTAGRILEVAIMMNMYNAVSGRGASALNANEHTSSDNIQTPIPSTQWHTEVSIWFSTCLAKLQSYMVEWATAPTNTVLGRENAFILHPVTDPVEAAMCRNQLVRDTGLHQSFSILGLALVLGVGGFIIVLGMTADTVVGWLHIGSKFKYRHDQWVLEQTLQLQRAAYEGFGVGGTWERKLFAAPTTAGSDVPVPSSSDVFSGESASKWAAGSRDVDDGFGVTRGKGYGIVGQEA